jgi:hypothetical protein
MEDEGFIDDDFIEDTARDYVRRFGLKSVAMLRERAGIAEQAGEYVLAQGWREMAEAAQRLLGFDTAGFFGPLPRGG